MTPIELNEQKRQAARRALEALAPGKSLALGTGSTSEIFIRELSQWPHAASLRLCSTSLASSTLAQKLGLIVEPLEAQDELDYSIDGADFVDSHHQLLKGFGGAFTREKIAARLARELWIMVDDTKLKRELPLQRIPCELLPSSLKLVERSLKERSLTGQLRLKEGEPWLTDNGGFIFDVNAQNWKKSLEELDFLLKSQCGILEHGLFLNFPLRLFAGH